MIVRICHGATAAESEEYLDYRRATGVCVLRSIEDDWARERWLCTREVSGFIRNFLVRSIVI